MFPGIPEWAGMHCRTSSVLIDSILMLSFIVLMMLSCLGHGIALDTDLESKKIAVVFFF